MTTHYAVPSTTTAGTHHVTLDPSHCTCEGFRWRQTCKHIELVQSAPDDYAKERTKPMLAKPWRDEPITDCKFALEEKFDGHRILVQVNGADVRAWSRLGNDSTHRLPDNMLLGFATMPNGLYDGELVTEGASRSYSVSRLDNRAKLTCVIFDVLRLLRTNVMKETYDRRRDYLCEIFGRLDLYEKHRVHLVTSLYVRDANHLEVLCQNLFSNGSEGAIVKRRDGVYRAGKRSNDFLKIKAIRSAVLTIVGWQSGTTGAHNVAVLRDDEGNETRVKVRDDALRARVEEEHEALTGQRLRIEYQERTPDGSYRHPRWDRLEDE